MNTLDRLNPFDETIRPTVDPIAALRVGTTEAFDLLLTARTAHHAAFEQATIARESLADTERELLLDGAITGKNEVERTARMADLTQALVQTVRDASRYERGARLKLDAALDAVNCIRLHAALVGK